MGAPHKHRDVIIAWANGEEVEFFTDDCGWLNTDQPNWHEDMQYRIKPKRVKKEGWVNVYPDQYFGEIARIFPTEYLAREYTSLSVACIRIEWEEEQCQP